MREFLYAPEGYELVSVDECINVHRRYGRVNVHESRREFFRGFRFD